MSDDQAYMQQAIDLAARVLTATPNPRVGAVVVKDGRVVGTGWHEQVGRPHAEVVALQDAGELARGATVYVSLEPCCMVGRTPPCTDALIQAGVASVVYGMQDPNPAVSGRGLDRLREAGIEVRGPLLQERAAALNPGFIKRMTQQLPRLRCKMAMSLDGRTAMASGESQWITGEEARADVQCLRASSCAVLTGVNTVIADNPHLNVRAAQLPLADAELIARRQPLRVVMDSCLRTPPDSRIIGLPGEVLLMSSRPQPRQVERFAGSKAQIVEVACLDNGRVDLRDALRTLAIDYECNEVLLETGPTLGGAMVQAGLVDEVLIYVGARFLGSDAMPLLHLPGIQFMKDHVALEMRDVQMIGRDCRIRAELRSLLPAME